MPGGGFVPFASGQRLPGFRRTECEFHGPEGVDPPVLTSDGARGFKPAGMDVVSLSY
jgi:hypothetical protein